jgi:hypothetical protein
MYSGVKGLRIGQVAYLTGSGFGTYAVLTKASWEQDSTKQEFRDGTGYIFGVSSLPNPPTATWQYYVGTNTTSSAAAVTYPAVTTKFDVTATGTSSSLALTGWLCDKVSFDEMRGHEEATQVSVTSTYYGF